MSTFQSVPPHAADVDQLFFQSDLVAVGAFRCKPGHPLFHDSGPIRNHCFVFPRTAVIIEHEAERPFQGDPTSVLLYNTGQVYRRRAISPDGDRCDYFVVAPDILRRALCDYDTSAADREADLFRLTRATSDDRLYLWQRRVFSEATSGGLADALDVEESVVGLLDRVLALVHRGRGTVSLASGISGGRATLAARARRLLATHTAERNPLSSLARSLECSPFHLCRAFKEDTGLSLNQYRDRLRLRKALELIERGAGLTDVALEVGYSSHSHFTLAFRRIFGMTPTAFRRSRERGESFLQSIATVEDNRPRFPVVR